MKEVSPLLMDCGIRLYCGVDEVAVPLSTRRKNPPPSVPTQTAPDPSPASVVMRTRSRACRGAVSTCSQAPLEGFRQAMLPSAATHTGPAAPAHRAVTSRAGSPSASPIALQRPACLSQSPSDVPTQMLVSAVRAAYHVDVCFVQPGHARKVLHRSRGRGRPSCRSRAGPACSAAPAPARFQPCQQFPGVCHRKRGQHRLPCLPTVLSSIRSDSQAVDAALQIGALRPRIPGAVVAADAVVGPEPDLPTPTATARTLFDARPSSCV